jgi:serine/threonine protein kinase
VSGESDSPDEQAGRGDSSGDVPPTFRRQGPSTLELTPPTGDGGGADRLPLPPGELLAERFNVLRFVARGGMGAVYEATDVVLRSRVALKVLEGPIIADKSRWRGSGARCSSSAG